tara:strand:- start:248 stop:550 length:303 start_codon:yes stop_codon:yes gene_type:complete
MAIINISEQDHMQALYNLILEMSEAAEGWMNMSTVSEKLLANRARYQAAENMVFFLMSQYHKSTCACTDNRRDLINSIKKRTGCSDYHAGVIIDQLRDAA